MAMNKDQHAVSICSLCDSVLKDCLARSGRQMFIPLVDLGPKVGMYSYGAHQLAKESRDPFGRACYQTHPRI